MELGFIAMSQSPIHKSKMDKGNYMAMCVLCICVGVVVLKQ